MKTSLIFLFTLLATTCNSAIIAKIVHRALKDLSFYISGTKLLKLEVPKIDFHSILNRKLGTKDISKSIESMTANYNKQKRNVFELKSSARTLKTLPIPGKSIKIPKIKRSL
eukprot:NODE_200_length_15202_cov_0.356618.p11 type:complete len:112 gc:universal NODE_200_length_15202_cov_0.356618:12571-12906(+)